MLRKQVPTRDADDGDRERKSDENLHLYNIIYFINYYVCVAYTR